jgi:hypothetical protein
LLLLFILGAAKDRIQFLTFFCFGATGCGLGYLTGVWLAPSSSSEETRFVKAGNIIATLFAGAVGTKLLSVWDDLTKNGKIFDPDYFLPLLCGIAGFFVALAAFYTLRTAFSGQVRITAPGERFLIWTDSKGQSFDNGVPLGSQVQFAGVAEYADDLSVRWELKPLKTDVHASVLPANTITAYGLLTVPDQAWLQQHTNAAEWNVVATSNRDRSKYAVYPIRFLDRDNVNNLET